MTVMDIEYLIILTKSPTQQIIWLDFDIDDNKDSIEYEPVTTIKFQKIDNEFISTSAIYNESLVNYLINKQIASVITSNSEGYKKYILKLTPTALLTLI